MPSYAFVRSWQPNLLVSLKNVAAFAWTNAWYNCLCLPSSHYLYEILQAQTVRDPFLYCMLLVLGCSLIFSYPDLYARNLAGIH